MDKNIKYLLIPDVHGRTFWMDPVNDVLENTDAHIVFLGDYLDPYPFEWDYGVPYQKISIERFEEIIKLKKDHPDRITLLLGNHDAGYAIGTDICSCRMDHRNYAKIESLFKDNKELFQIAETVEVAGKKYNISHAGILKGWAKSVWGDEAEADDFNVVDRLNNAWLTDDWTILDRLGDYDSYRGYAGFLYGSPIWSDIRSWYKVEMKDTYYYNIVGHTMMNQGPLAFTSIMCIDFQKAFYIDDKGTVRRYDTDEEVKIIVFGNKKEDGKA